MNISIKEISKSEYKQIKIPALFEDELIDRAFGVVSDGKNEYKLGWQSVNIKPVIKWINIVCCSIGIDLMFVVFEFNTGKILQKLSLAYYFYDTIIFNGAIYVITQLEIVKIDIIDLVIIETYALPDYFENIEFDDKIIVIKCIGNEVVHIE